ncbi:MAG TPA: creatininase family protein [Anaerolineaceae bacterium]|nr:creatininase family protein [Anaerolineaceae bacterium]
MRFDDLNWMDVERYLQHDDRVMLVLGACEQHGYLSLACDTRIPLALADAASRQTGVLVAPPLGFGVSPYFLAYPGTISLRLATFLDVVTDLVQSLYTTGFRRLLVLNGHGGNDPARGRLTELANELPDLQLAWYAWWTAESVSQVAQAHQLRPYHASWLEAFPFTVVGDLPAGEKTPPAFKGLPSAAAARQIYGDGVFGGAYAAPDGVMQEVFDAALKDILFQLDF